MCDDLVVTYCYAENYWICFADILGYASAWSSTTNGDNSGEHISTKWIHCVEQCRKHIDTKNHKKINFFQFTDSLVIYGSDIGDVLKCVDDLFGTAVV